jgi:hypothetical protein
MIISKNQCRPRIKVIRYLISKKTEYFVVILGAVQNQIFSMSLMKTDY